MQSKFIFPFTYLLVVCVLLQTVGCKHKQEKYFKANPPKTNHTCFDHPYLITPGTYYGSNFDSAIYFYKEAAVKFNSEKNYEGFVKSYYLIGSCFARKRMNDSAFYYLQQSEEIAEKELLLNNITRFRCYYYFGEYYIFLRDSEKALTYFKKCETMLADHFVDDHPAWADVYGSIGEVYFHSVKNYDKAEEYLTKAININKKLSDNLADLANNYYNLCCTYHEKGDYYKALAYNEKAIELYKKANSNDSYVANCHTVKGNIYQDMDSIRFAIKSHKEALQLSKKSNRSILDNYYNNLGGDFIQLRQFDSAKICFWLSISNNSNENATELSNSWSNLGNAFAMQGMWDSAYSYYRMALVLRTKAFGRSNRSTAWTIKDIGKLFARKNDHDLALRYYQDALCLLINGFHDSLSILSNPIDTSIKEGSLELLDLLYVKGCSLEKKYESNKNIRFLSAASHCYALADYVIDLNRRSYQEEGSKLFLMSSYKKIYDRAINCAYTIIQLLPNQIYKGTVFNIMEKTKYALLLENLFEMEKEQKFEYSNSKEQEEIRSNRKVLALYEVQNRLQDNQQVLEYYWGDSTIFVMGITKTDVVLLKLEDRKSIERNIYRYIHLLTTDSIASKEIDQLKKLQEFSNVSNALYKQLVKGFVTRLKDKPITEQTLIIVPDGLLSFIPFESFISKHDSITNLSYKRLPYLLNQYQITYSYSSNILFNYLQHRKNEIDLPPLFMGYFKNETKNSTPSKRSITSSGSKAFYNIATSIGNYREASMVNLQDQLPKNGIIQLNVHGVVDKKIPALNKLLLSDTCLYSSQILSMDLKNKTILLTACETGIGIQYKGEGVYSLARSFIYAGCSSVVMSLWKIPERGTLQFMNDFYSALLSGQSVDRSLTFSKRKYLERSDNITSHPRFWTGLVSVSNLKPIQYTGAVNYRKIVGGILFFLIISILLYIYIYKKKRSLGNL